MIKIKKIISIGLLFYGSIVLGQSSLNTSGGDATGSTGSVAYSIGQVFYVSHTGNNGKIAEGVQQAFELYTLDIKDITLKASLSIMPNPVIEKLMLHIGNYTNQNLFYQLFDFQGRILDRSAINAEITEIDMSRLPTALYLLYILNQDKKRVQSFKVIKR
jgi:hypothetical protein